MGSFVNGVYVPVVGEVDWDAEVNDFLTRSGQEYINVRQAPYGAAADDTTDDSGAFSAAIDDAPEGGCVLFPPGHYVGRIEVTDKRVTLLGAGAGTVIRSNSADPTVDIALGLTYNAGFNMRGFRIANQGAGDGMRLTGVQRGRIADVMVVNAGYAGWMLRDCILMELDSCGFTVNDDPDGINGSAPFGLVLDSLTFGCYINTFTNFIAEGCTTAGWELRSALMNVFQGGTSEGNAIGLRFNPNGSGQYTRDNWFHALWFESNSGADIAGLTTYGYSSGRNYISYNGPGGAMSVFDGIGNHQVNGPLIWVSPPDTYNVDAPDAAIEIASIFGNNDASPEGLYAAVPSSIYLPRQDGDVYIKRSGTGTTGWRPISTERGVADLSGDTSPYAIDGANYEHFEIIRTPTGAYTISNPTGWVVGRRISFLIYNTSGGAITATWGADFHLAGAWTDPANAKARTITFIADGALAADAWVELGRSAADIT